MWRFSGLVFEEVICHLLVKKEVFSLLNCKYNFILEKVQLFYYLSPQVGLEPTTNRLTADRSTAELLRIVFLLLLLYHTLLCL